MADFIITGIGREGPVAFRAATGKTAIEKALKFVGRGMSDVIVTDLSGRSYSIAELPLLLNGCRNSMH